MKILHINISDINGGAAVAAYRLHNAMLSSGINSKYFVLDRTINDRDDIISVSRYEKYLKKIVNIALEKITVKNIDKKMGLFSSFKYGVNITKYREVVEADIIYLHWINSIINYKLLKKILRFGKPVFWFLHDMFAITGGCHHSYDCFNYTGNCVKCPYIKRRNILSNLSRWQYKKKKNIYKKFDNLFFITPSKWLYECTLKSGLTKTKKIYHIPNLINTNQFKPIDRKIAQSFLALDHTKKYIGFCADGAITNPYKGFEYLENALKILVTDYFFDIRQIELLIAGSNCNNKISEKIPFRCNFLGKLYDEYSIIIFYNALDVFVVSSLADNFPNTILESLSCNIPVVGFDVGGISDMVSSSTGYLAEYKNAVDLARGIVSVLSKNYDKQNMWDVINSVSVDNIVARHRMTWNAIHL
jgi:glycosyltransferase involved in cell wall biosynthesis